MPIPTVTKLEGSKVYGALNIGKLTPINIMTIDNEPVFLNEKDELVYCSDEVFQKVNERLAANGL